ncbi:hypothetical protein H6770_04180 [Candidatus Peribacteria bacterium]|nr:hypothetical protein [Candidatus Peribacteria bacterium]
MNANHFIVLFPDEGEPLASFEKRIIESKGEVVVLFSGMEPLLVREKDARQRLMNTCKKYSTRLRIASRHALIIKGARQRGIRVVSTVSDLKKLLSGSVQLEDAVREFQPHIWRQQLRSQLQRMGLLSLPKLRIWLLIFISVFLFGFVVFRLLPSAEIRVWPQEEPISQTANIFLAQSGAIASLPERVRVLDLIPITVRVDKTITFDQISREFIGTNATTLMQVSNNSLEPYWLKQGSRLRNEAGMIFRIRDSIKVEPGEHISVLAEADPVDIFGEILGDRGNVPAGLKWNFTGLDPDEQKLVFATNIDSGTGAVSSYRTVLSAYDIDVAKKQLETELLSEAKRLIEEQRDVMNARGDGTAYDILYYDELTQTEFMDMDLPTEFINAPVKTIPVTGSIMYTMYVYDTQKVLDMLSREITSHVNENRRLLEHTLKLSSLVTHVIDYTDDFSWIKITVDLTGTEQHILDPLSPTGAVFAKKVRKAVKGLHSIEAQRIVNNFPEVKKAEVSVWPPWSSILPTIPSSIVITPVLKDE